jgi:hypothetical protein
VRKKVMPVFSAAGQRRSVTCLPEWTPIPEHSTAFARVFCIEVWAKPKIEGALWALAVREGIELYDINHYPKRNNGSRSGALFLGFVALQQKTSILTVCYIAMPLKNNNKKDQKVVSHPFGL